MEFIKTKLKYSVGYALNQSVQELLPDEIRKTPLSHWLLNFFAPAENKRSIDYKQLDVNNSIMEIISSSRRNSDLDEKKVRSNSKFNNDNSFETIVTQILQTSLTPNLGFYYTSLFHLGRQWQVSTQALETANKALEKNNLVKTIEQNSLLLQDELIRLEVPEQEHQSILFDAIVGILKTAQKQHLNNIEKAKTWWTNWQEEVAEFQKIVLEIDKKIGVNLKNYKYERKIFIDKKFLADLVKLTTFSFSQKLLYQSFLEDGIKFKEAEVLDQNQESLILKNLAYLSLLSNLTEEKSFSGRDRFWELERIIRDFTDLQHKERYAPIDRKVEEQLLKDFEGENPFEKYCVLKSPPDRSLIDLWNKCKLPSGENFYYAQNWLNSLDSDLNYYWRELPFTSNLTDKHIESYARAIDSKIKREWVSGGINTTNKVGKTDANLIQYLFEKECIVNLVIGAVYPSREKKGEQKWNVNNFIAMIERVIQFLNAQGYTLENPSKNRFERLWDLAIQNNTRGSTW